MATKRQLKKRGKQIAKNTQLDNQISEGMAMLNSLYSTSAPRGFFSGVQQSLIDISSRDEEYIKRYEMYRNTFTREMVKVLIVRAIGTTHDNIKPFEIELKTNTELNDEVKEALKKEFDYITELIDDALLEVALDSQFFGDGYVKREIEEGKGITKLLTNFSTKPFNITPIVSNKGKTIAYEISNNTQIFDVAKQNSFSFAHKKQVNSRLYVAPYVVGRMNARSNGIKEISEETVTQLENMNLFSKEETIYEDTVYGGVVEGCKESFDNFKWAITALANKRIQSSVLERFIIHNLGNVSEADKELLKKALEAQIKGVQAKIKARTEAKDPNLLIANHIIPTTGDGVNNVSIQESTPDAQGLNTIEDIMIHIKNYMADIGFNIEMTPFGSDSIGGGERDGVVQNSLQMDAQGEQIRKAIRGYVLDTLKVHFLAKYGRELDLSLVEVNFTSVLNTAKLIGEQQRLEAVSNTQQLASVIEQYKGLQMEDNKENRLMLTEIFRPLLLQTSDNKETQIKSIVDTILAKPKTQGEEL